MGQSVQDHAAAAAAVPAAAMCCSTAGVTRRAALPARRATAAGCQAQQQQRAARRAAAARRAPQRAGSSLSLTHMVWNCARNTGSFRMSDRYCCAKASSLVRKVAICSFICARLLVFTCSPVALYRSCVVHHWWPRCMGRAGNERQGRAGKEQEGSSRGAAGLLQAASQAQGWVWACGAP